MQRRVATPSSCRGLTLVEILVVLAVVAVLLALLLPAVQATRESARLVQCRNNLKNMALAMHNHHDAVNHLPTGGWGYLWVGTPKRGNDPSQPGGWIFALMPYVEQSAIYKIAADAGSDAELRTLLAQMIQKPVPLYSCPSRRPNDPYPTQWQARNTDLVANVAKSDYAACAGSVFLDVGTGPISLAQGDSSAYSWPDYPADGICYLRSTVRFTDISDGASNTILLGEKNLPRGNYYNGMDSGDDQSMYSGDDFDILRWTTLPWTPLNDRVGDVPGKEFARFGSAHRSGCNIALCDGSARIISYEIDAKLFESLGSRNDAKPTGNGW